MQKLLSETMCDSRGLLNPNDQKVQHGLTGDEEEKKNTKRNCALFCFKMRKASLGVRFSGRRMSLGCHTTRCRGEILSLPKRGLT
jgi:hypothetical protein